MRKSPVQFDGEAFGLGDAAGSAADDGNDTMSVHDVMTPVSGVRGIDWRWDE